MSAKEVKKNMHHTTRYTCFITPEDMQRLCAGSTCTLTKQYHYIHNVIRLRINDTIACISTSGIIATARITHIYNKSVTLALMDMFKKEPVPYTIILAIANTKNIRKTWILEKAVELNVKHIIVWQAERSTIPLVIKDTWNDILENAATQCQNPFIPSITAYPSLRSLIAYFKESNITPLFFYEDAYNNEPLTAQLCKTTNPIACIIGPEGGFSEHEVALLLQNTITPYSLGSSLLRYETAALVSLSILYMLNDEKGITLPQQ